MTNLNKFAELTNNELFDPDYNGGEWMVEAIETQETLEDFETAAEKSWEEYSGLKKTEVAGFKFISFKSMQLRKGDQRDSFSVIDFGDKRYALKGTDLSLFL